MKHMVLAALLCGLLSHAAHADFQQGKAAFVAHDYAKALKEFEPLARAGDMQSQHILGMMYDEGQGVAQDYAKAADWYQKAIRTVCITWA